MTSAQKQDIIVVHTTKHRETIYTSNQLII